MDIILPDLNGVEVLKEIRRIAEGEPVKVILISVKSLGPKEQQLCELGYDDYIKKPISLQRLEQSVQRLL